MDATLVPTRRTSGADQLFGCFSAHSESDGALVRENEASDRLVIISGLSGATGVYLCENLLTLDVSVFADPGEEKRLASKTYLRKLAR